MTDAFNFISKRTASASANSGNPRFLTRFETCSSEQRQISARLCIPRHLTITALGLRVKPQRPQAHRTINCDKMAASIVHSLHPLNHEVNNDSGR